MTADDDGETLYDAAGGEPTAGDANLHPEVTRVSRDPIRETPAPSPTSAEAEGWPRTVGPYSIVTELGRGGQGVVFLAHDPRLNRQIALKILTVPLLAGSDPLTRFRREAAAAARLDHPGICPVYEIGAAAGAHYIAMRYVEGESLSKKLAAARRDSNKTTRASVTGSTVKDDLQRLASIIEQAARALHAAHEEGVVHRDVKPANLMITPDGEVVVMDFGLAHDRHAVEESLTRTGDIFGTPTYMAPEQLQPAVGTVDRRIDVYALGVTLYEALTLRAPFAAQTRQALFHQILTEEPVDPRRLNPAIPRDLAVIIAVAMEKTPTRRYQTALALAEDLARFRNLEPILARPAGPVLRAARWAQRNPGLAVLSAGLVVGLTSGLVWTGLKNAELKRAYGAVIDERNEKEAARAKEKRRAEEIRALANEALFGVSDAISNLPGATKARALIVEKGLKSIESLSRDAEAEPALRRDLAFAYMRVGDILGNPGASNLGRMSEAADKFREAIRIFDELLRESPNDADLLVGEARVRMAACYIRFEEGKTDEAFELGQAALEFAKRATALRPDDDSAMTIRIDGARRIGEIMVRRGLIKDCIAIQREAVAYSENYVETHPNRLSPLRATIAAQLDLATALAQDAATEEAIATYLRAEKLAGEIKISDVTDNQEALRLRGRISGGLARAWLVAKDLDKAETYAETARGAACLRAQRDPANTQAQIESAFAIERVADILAYKNRPEEAFTRYMEALAIWKRLDIEQPKSQTIRHGVMKTEACAGDMLAVQKMDEKALEHHAAAGAIAEALFAEDEKNAVHARDLAVNRMKIGEDHQEIAKREKDDDLALDHWKKATESFTTALEIINKCDLMNRVGGVDKGMRKYVEDQIAASKRKAAEIDD